MPSEKVLAQKQAQVAELADELRNAQSGVLVDYKGITVGEDTKLRAEMRKAGVKYTVYKNTIIRFAAKQAGLEGLDSLLKGTTAIATSSTDLVAPAKIVAKYAEGKEKYNIKGGFIEGRFAPESDIIALAKLPSKEVLVAKALGGLNAPIAGFVNVLSANLSGLVRVLNAAAEKKSA